VPRAAWEAPQESRRRQIPIDFGLAVAAVAGVADLVEGHLVVDESADRQGRFVVEVDCIPEGCSFQQVGPAALEAFDRLVDSAAMAVGDNAAVVEDSLVRAVNGIPVGADNPLGIAGFARILVAGPEGFRTDPSASTATTPGHPAKPRTRSRLYFLPDPTSLTDGSMKQE
jgi:hypothetical protein